EVLEQVGMSGTVYGFTGEQEDGATGLLYLRARYYDSSLKTFMSRDPWEGTGWRPGTLNYYAYVHGNPVNWVDHTGNDIEKPNDVEVDSPYTWKLPTTNTVQELAEVFMIPSELLGAILQIVQEVDYSTTGTLDNDWLEDCV